MFLIHRIYGSGQQRHDFGSKRSHRTFELTRRRESKHPPPHQASYKTRSRRSRPTICSARVLMLEVFWPNCLSSDAGNSFDSIDDKLRIRPIKMPIFALTRRLELSHQSDERPCVSE